MSNQGSTEGLERSPGCTRRSLLSRRVNAAVNTGAGKVGPLPVVSSGAGDWRSRPEEDRSLRVPLQHEATYVRVARVGGAADHDGVVVVRGRGGCVATRLLVDEHGPPRKGYAVRILWVEEVGGRERFNYLLHITSVILQCLQCLKKERNLKQNDC